MVLETGEEVVQARTILDKRGKWAEEKFPR